MRRLFKTTGLLLCALTLSGCVSLLLGTKDSPPRFTLEPVKFSPISEESKLDVSLVITDPHAEAAFATSQIALSTKPLRYEYYENAQWADRAPRLFGIFLQRSFENHGALKAVGDRGMLAAGDYVLTTDIRSFHIDSKTRNTVARIAFSLRLTDGRNKTISTKLFEINQPVAGNDLFSAIDAFNIAAEQAGKEAVLWTVAEIKDNSGN